MYDLDCMRCKKKLTQDEATCSNHCSHCLPFVNEKWSTAIDKINALRKEADDYSTGKDL